MHELAIIQELVDNVLKQAKHNGINEVTQIKLTIGKLSGVLPQALEFGFNAIKPGTMLENAQLIINELKPLLYCSSCEHKFIPDGWLFTCNSCGSCNVSIIEGQELILEYFEGNTKGEQIND